MPPGNPTPLNPSSSRTTPPGSEEAIRQFRDATPSERASEIVTGPRREAYGHPLPNHKRIAAFWTVRLKDKLQPGVTIEPHDVTAMMRLVKEARLMNTPGHDDSLLDIAGYADVEWLIHHDPPRRNT